MNIDLKGKTALVCGASKGIGEAIARELAHLGASVTLMARSAEKLEKLIAELDNSAGQKHHFMVADFTNVASIESLIKEQDMSYHILINNTGGPAGGRLRDAKLSAFEQVFTMHLHVSHLLVKYLTPYMITENYGRIINVISTSVKIPIPGLGVSNTVRGAMASWAKTLANELAGEGITVNNILPGFVETDRLIEIVNNRVEKQGVDKATVVNEMKESTPAGRFALPGEVGYLAGFLASPSAAYITGTSIPIDGGRTGSI